ncbi:LysR family transcriptional regulator [Paracoccus sp. MBLB3053]|uniref:LysR family transcriptional regulator n=1 Tax=Paracoccus aurantius TaxID=3073814 RepID=A0ABU2HVF9_9RHOB|nr:LysR family transcriptional regulator [Paracoccus sp. MBLB3053]MDS9469028.1 LysR family transcriptional regulator [Paracoccus sp. MBLB3053]
MTDTDPRTRTTPTAARRSKSRGAIPVESADIRLIRIFLRVVEAGGLSAAQSELNLALSSISEKISALEARYGLKLCKRGRSGFSLTPAGEDFYKEAQRLLGSLDQFSNRVAGFSSQMPRSLAVGLVDTIISDPLCPVSRAVAKFAEAAPSVHLEIATLSPGELLREVIGQKVDLAVGSFPRAAMGLDYLSLHDEQHNLYCACTHQLFDMPDPQIGIDSIREHRIIARSYWASRDIRVFAISAPHATVSNMEAEAHLILSGAYLGYLPDHYAAKFPGQLRAIRPDLFSYVAKFQVAARQDWQSRQATRAFIEALQEASSELRAR